MNGYSTVREDLYRLVVGWEAQTRDTRDHSQHRLLLDQVLFHADTRFNDYVQYQEEGVFPVRLKKWLECVDTDAEKQTLLRLLSSLLFVDRLQMQALRRDAYRRIIVPWIRQGELTIQDVFGADYNARLVSLLKQYALYSITESFNFPEFINVNSLAGLKKPIILGEVSKSKVASLMPDPHAEIKGLIFFEDFVGTGDQAGRLLMEARRVSPSQWRMLFVPLIILEKGLNTLKTKLGPSGIEFSPVFTVPESHCVKEAAVDGEPQEFASFRALAMSTRERVLQRLGEGDDPPKNPFGYLGSGALVVTCHNTPNNTLPLIHHRAPQWFALFRRVHYSNPSSTVWQKKAGF